MKQAARAGALFFVALFAIQSAFADINEALAAYNRKDYTTAIKQFRALAVQGDANAQYDLGLMYQNGEGVTADDKEAFAWFRKAAENGLAQAQTQVGLMYYTGVGIPQDDTEAAAWFRKATEQGFTDSRADLEQFGKSFVMTTKTDSKQSGTTVWVNDVTGRASYTEFSELDTAQDCRLKDAYVMMHFKDTATSSILPTSGTLTIVLSMDGDKTNYDLPYEIDDSSLILLNGQGIGQFDKYMFGALARAANGIDTEAHQRERELEKKSSFSFNFTTNNGTVLSLEFSLEGLDEARLRNLMIFTKGC